MSAFFGIFDRSGKKIDKKTADAMLDAMCYWDPDDQGIYIDSSVALGHAMLWNTPESKYEHLPLHKDVTVLTMDARIDNREELAKEIELPDGPLSEIGDSAFILGAYKKWGEDCPEYLLGDFAFAIWDHGKEQFFCARDHIGIKPFYYYASDELFVFTNELRVIEKHPKIPKKMSDKAVADYLIHSLLTDNTLTFFEGVKKLPAASTLVVTSSGVETSCYWQPENAPKVTLPDAQSYAAKLRELIEEAVACRLRSAYPVTSHLSGGLDSSTIATIAARKLHKRGEKLLAFNWLHVPEKNEDASEPEWHDSMRIAKSENIEHHYVKLDADDIYELMNSHNIAYGDSAGFWYEYPVRTAAQKRGSRTILSGWGGDELSTYHGGAFLSNMIKDGEFRTFFSEIKHWIPAKKRKSLKSILSLVYHHVLIPFVPRRFYCRLPKTYCKERCECFFVKKEFLALIEDARRKPAALTMQAYPTIKEHMIAALRNGHLQARCESWAASAFANRIEYAYPLLDRRIVEFLLGVPARYFMHKGIGRYLFRSAVEGILPEKIRWSSPKREPHRAERLLRISKSAYQRQMKALLKSPDRSNYLKKGIAEDSLEVSPEDPSYLRRIIEAGNILTIVKSERAFLEIY